MAEREFRIHPAAAGEAEVALAWYRDRNPRAATGFLFDLEHAIDRIREAPDAWPRVGRRARRYVFPRFPFSLVYRVSPTLIEVVAVAHHRRKPGYWKSR